MLQGREVRPAAEVGGRCEQSRQAVELQRQLCPAGQAAVKAPALANLAGIKGPSKRMPETGTGWYAVRRRCMVLRPAGSCAPSYRLKPG